MIRWLVGQWESSPKIWRLDFMQALEGLWGSVMFHQCVIRFSPILSQGIYTRSAPVNYRYLDPSGASISYLDLITVNNNRYLPHAFRILHHLIESCRVYLHVIVLCGIAIG